MRPAPFFPLVLAFAAISANPDRALAEEPPGDGAPEGSAAGPSAPTRPKLTLPRILELARQRSPLIEQARAQILVREAQQYEAETNWYPSGEITLGMAPAPTVKCQTPPGLMKPDNLSEQDFRLQNCTATSDPRIGVYAGNELDAFRAIAGVLVDFNIRLTQPLYTFGKIEHGRRAAMAGIEAEKARTEAARYESDLLVSRAYWGLKTARTSKITAGEVRDQLTKWVDKIEADLDADKPKFNFTQSDLTRLKVALAQVQILIGDFDRLAIYAENGLRAAVREPVDIDDDELEPQEIVEHPLDYYQQEAVLHRPEVRALDAGSRAYAELAKVQFSYMLPDLGLNTSFSLRKASTDIDEPSNAFMNHINTLGFGISIGLRVPLDIMLRRARWLRTRAEATGFDAQRDAALAWFGLEVTQAWSNLNEARQRMATLDRAQRQAQGWMNSMDQALDLAMTDTASATRDFVDAARNYFDLRLRYYQSIFDVNLQIAQLRRATGVEVAR